MLTATKTQPLTPTQLAQYRVGLFATHESLDSALTYAMKIARATDNAPAVLTAVHVVLNTVIAAMQPQE